MAARQSTMDSRRIFDDDQCGRVRGTAREGDTVSHWARTRDSSSQAQTSTCRCPGNFLAQVRVCIELLIMSFQNFPRFIVNFAKRFATGSYASALSAPKVDGEPLFRDEFGFRQVIVAATPYGKVFGIDSSNGDIVWSRVFGLGWAAQVGGRMIPVKLFVTRTASDGDTPQVVIVAQRKADNVSLMLLAHTQPHLFQRTRQTLSSSTSMPYQGRMSLGYHRLVARCRG